MELTPQELDLLYALTRHETNTLRGGDYTKQPEPGSYAAAIYELDAKMTADFHKRKQTMAWLILFFVTFLINLALKLKAASHLRMHKQFATIQTQAVELHKTGNY